MEVMGIGRDMLPIRVREIIITIRKPCGFFFPIIANPVW
jgi:hypothetical protein